MIITWLLTILNSVIELEAIPKSLKKGVLSPVFKGHGKDPLLVAASLLHQCLRRF